MVAVLLALLLLLARSGCSAQDGEISSALLRSDQERQVLLQFAGNISNWAEVQAARQLAGWAPCTLASCVPVCTWTGVLCDPQGPGGGLQVSTLDLSCNANCAVPMRGRLAPGLEQLQFLRELDLSWNELEGTLPPEWGARAAFPSLQALNLQHNVLSGEIPRAWAWGGGFQEIVDFQLGSNRITGTFPEVATTNTSFTKMQSFNIANNSFYGTLPDFWNGLIILVRVQIQQNNFTGPIPPNWGTNGYLYNNTVNNTNVLESLYMHENRLTGTLPAGFAAPGSFTSLRELTLAGNPLRGGLPLMWGDHAGALPRLERLNLSGCGLSGPLPAWGAGLQALREIVLTRNELTGMVPASWARLASLSNVFVAPGNPRLCTDTPDGAQFTLCSATDVLCLSPLPVNASNCAASSGGGGGVPVAAIVVPTAAAVVVTLALVVCVWRRRRRAAEPVKAASGAAAAATVLEMQSEPAPKLWPGQDSPLPSAAPPSLSGHTHVSHLTPKSGSTEDLGRNSSANQQAIAAAAAAAAVAAAAAAAAAIGPAEKPRAQSCGYPSGHGMPAPVPGQLAPVSSLAPLGSYEQRHGGASSAPLWLPYAPHSRGAAAPDAGSSSAQGAPPLSHQAWEAAALAAAAAAAAAAIAASRQSHSWSPDAPRLSGPLRPSLLSHGQRAAASAGASGGRAQWLPPLPARRPSWEPDLLPGPPDGRTSLNWAMEGRSPRLGDSDSLDLLLSDWEIDPEAITIARRPDGTPWRLGSGGFGTVFKAFRNGVTPVAVKVLRSNASDARIAMSSHEFVREIKLLRACRDTNILQFQGCCFRGGETLLVTEYCEGGNLAHNLRARTVGWYRRGKKVALDVARALVYLHSRRIVHLDIKSANVLLTRDGTAKVGDVGMAKIMQGDYVSGVVGTLAWSAPELLLGDRCTEKADIYSFGVVLWEIATGELPTRGQMRELQVPEDCPQEVAALINRCLAADPAARPTATEVVELLQKAPSAPVGGVAPRVPPAGPSGISRRPSPDVNSQRSALPPSASVQPAAPQLPALLAQMPSGGAPSAALSPAPSGPFSNGLRNGRDSTPLPPSVGDASPFAALPLQQAAPRSGNASPFKPGSGRSSPRQRSEEVQTPAWASLEQPAPAASSIGGSLFGSVPLPGTAAEHTAAGPHSRPPYNQQPPPPAQQQFLVQQQMQQQQEAAQALRAFLAQQPQLAHPLGSPQPQPWQSAQPAHQAQP